VKDVIKLCDKCHLTWWDEWYYSDQIKNLLTHQRILISQGQSAQIGLDLWGIFQFVD
jgi:hypothetical protein